MINIVASRTDGFGQRLKVILSAMQIAECYGMRMNFVWNEKSGEHGKYHACEPVLEIFSDRFVKEHFVKEKIDGPKFQLNQKYEKSAASFVVLDRFYNIGSPSFGKLFHSIDFSDKINNAIRKAQSVSLVNASALHLRGGDILYGPLRKYSVIHQGKIIPLPVAKKMVASSLEKKWIVFAQDESIQEEFRCNNNTLVSSSFHEGLSSNAEKFIFDVILMSRCENIFGGSSGVCDVAAMLSGLNVNFIDEFFSNQEIVEIIKSDPKFLSQNYDSFIMAQLNSTIYSYTKDKVERRLCIEKALSFDADNNGLLFLRDLACIDVGDFSAANNYMEEKVRWSIEALERNKLKTYMKDIQAFASRPSILRKVLSTKLLHSWSWGEYLFLDMLFASILYYQGVSEFLFKLQNDLRTNDFRYFFEIIKG